jgi:hypothetical protein
LKADFLRILVVDRRFSAAVALIAGLLTMLFGHWTDTSVWSFPWFLAAVWVLFYVPGTMLLPGDSAGITSVERVTIGLVLGMTASLAVYWALRLINLLPLFWVWPLAALLRHVIGLSRRRLRIQASSVAGHHWCLLALLIAQFGLLVFLRGFYANLARHADGTMTLDTSSVDVLLHASVAQELTHSLPPQIPFVAGQALSYHYGMDLVVAMLANLARLSVLDLIARFIPTLFVVMTTTAAYAFCARWLRSGYAGVFAALLIMVGEDFSFIPGLIVYPSSVWSALFLGAPTTFSLWVMNPMLPALAILFCGLLCLTLFQDTARAGWMYSSAFLFAILAEFKIFTALHVLLALGIAGLVLAVRSRQRSILKVWLWSLAFVAPLLIYRWIVTSPDTMAEWRISPWPYIPEMFKQFGWTTFFQVAIGPFEGRSITAAWVAVVLMIGLPLYLLLNLGVRGIGWPAIWRTLTGLNAHDPVRLVVAVFVVAGVFVSLLSRVTQPGAPLATQYNNAIWFFVESKQLVWPFALETLWRWSRGRRALSTATAFVAVVLLAVPSFVQFLGNIRKIPAKRIGRTEVALDDFLRSACAPGDVVFASQQTAMSIVMLTPCRVPLVPAYVLTAPNLVSARAADQALFWAAWTRGDVEWHTLNRYGSRFLVVPTRPGDEARPDGRRDRNGLDNLAIRFSNDDFTVLEIAR